jgi:hypothetical protein
VRLAIRAKLASAEHGATAGAAKKRDEEGAPVADTKVRQSTPLGGSRREKLASLEAARKKEQRRRTLTLLLICVVLAGALLAYPVYLAANDYIARNATLEELGSSISAASCDPITEETATGNQDHVDGITVTYSRFPPDSGQHYPSPAPFTKRFYTTEDRPRVEELVHNLEHGYTIAWYRSDLSGGQLQDMRNITKTFSKDDQNPANKFIAAPWDDATDGGAMPAGKNLVLTHWYADPNNPGDTSAHRGIRQACTEVSGAVIKEFMAKYPHTNSPEPSGA